MTAVDHSATEIGVTLSLQVNHFPALYLNTYIPNNQLFLTLI